MSLPEARNRCSDLKGLINKGIDPQKEKRQLSQTPNFGEFVSQHYLPYANANKRSVCNDESRLRFHSRGRLITIIMVWLR